MADFSPPINAAQIFADITETLQVSKPSVTETEDSQIKQSGILCILLMAVPTVTVRSGHMSLRRAVNAHTASLGRQQRTRRDLIVAN